MKTNRMLLAAVLFCVIGMIAADLWMPDRSFSAQENRRLAQRPKFCAAALADGSFMEAYEKYVTDQFPRREAFISVKVRAQKLLGKKDVNGVYFAPGRTLVERHGPESVNLQKAERKANRLEAQAKEIEAMIDGRLAVMLVPSAAAVQKQRLPAFAEEFDQRAWIEEAEKRLNGAGIITVPVFDALSAHSGEEIYFGTDHHWTSLGAFYGYQAFAKTFALPAAELTDYEKTVVKDDFYGTLQAKINLPVRPDAIEIFSRPGERKHPVRFPVEKREAESCYFYERLETKDAYAFFMDGNYPVVEIQGEGAPEKSILLIKDSFANCFVPFLTRDYGTIWMADRRYYRQDVTELVKEYGPVDVLYLYNVFQFIDHF